MIIETPGTTELSNDELRSRIALAKSVLGHAPLYRAVRKALRALDGASIEELAAAELDGAQEPPDDEPRMYLRGWHDGWDARDAQEMMYRMCDQSRNRIDRAAE
jgi:hypothetical protein